MGGFRTFSDRDAMARMRNNRSFVGDPGQIDPLLVGPGVEGMRQVIRRGIRKAEGFEFTSRGPVRLFLNMMVMFGSDFFNDPIYPWAGEILSQKAVPRMERAMQLHAAVNAYSDAVGGMHFKFERKAIEKAQSIGWEDLKPPPGRLCCRQFHGLSRYIRRKLPMSAPIRFAV